MEYVSKVRRDFLHYLLFNQLYATLHIYIFCARGVRSAKYVRRRCWQCVWIILVTDFKVIWILCLGDSHVHVRTGPHF